MDSKYSEVSDDDQELPFLGVAKPTSKKTITQKWLVLSIALLSIVAHVAILMAWKAPYHLVSNPPSKSSNKLYCEMHSMSDHGYNTDHEAPFHGVTDTRIEIWPEDAWDNTIYVGPPSEELDKAWDKLQAVEGMSITSDEAAMLNLSSHIQLTDGNQAVVVGYFHNLHCLRYLYQGLHPEVYKRSHATGHAGVEHSYHCLEVLRTSVLCQPDLTLHAIHWQDEQKRGMALQPESTRECMDFNAIYDLAMTRRFARTMITDLPV